MKIYKLHTLQRLPLDINKAWEFFSSPANLSVITPKEMNFVIIGDLPKKMYPGLIINYTVKALPGFKVNWMTEITHVNEPFFFVDEQRAGPYKIWHHEHHFREIESGIEMEDIVHYALPFDPFSRILHPLLIRSKLNGIFNYRYNKLIELFGTI